MVIDLDKRRYNNIELVKPTRAGTFEALDSHCSGLAWANQYLYSSSLTTLSAFNADDLMYIDGSYVLPAFGQWAATGANDLSALTVDQSRSGAIQLINLTYLDRKSSAWSQSYSLRSPGLLRDRKPNSEVGSLKLTRQSGTGPQTVRNSEARTFAGTNYQGIGIVGRYQLLNSSSLHLDQVTGGDYLVVFDRTGLLAKFRMPRENFEGIYIDEQRQRYVTVTEHGQQFLFWLPLSAIFKAVPAN